MKVLAAALALAAVLSGAQAAVSVTVTDVDILNFALQLECLEGAFYTMAAYGTNLSSSQLGGGGPIIGGNKAVLQGAALDFAQELAYDEANHIKLLRDALGPLALPCPEMDIGPAFATVGNALLAYLDNPNPYAPFTPYKDFISFYAGSFIFEDVGVTAYAGAAPIISNETYLSVATGILAVEAYHAGAIRLSLSEVGYFPTPYGINITTAIGDIAAIRAELSGAADDVGIVYTGGSVRLVDDDANALPFTRTPEQVLGVVYLTGSPLEAGGFFPKGINGIFSPKNLNALVKASG